MSVRVIVTQEALSTPNPKTGGHNDLNFMFWVSSKIFENMNGLATTRFTISDKIEMHNHLCVAANGVNYPSTPRLLHFEDLQSQFRTRLSFA